MYFSNLFLVLLVMIYLNYIQVDSSSYMSSVAVKTSDCWTCGMTFGYLQLMVRK